jgi:hypothetical protein
MSDNIPWHRRNPERHRENVRRWRQNNPEKNLQINRDCLIKHREQRNAKANNKYHTNPALRLWESAKSRSKKRNLPFDISVEDIVVPDVCPAIGIPILLGQGKICDNSPSLDRIIPERGYIKGNVVVVSVLANAMKRNATIAQMRSLLIFYENLIVQET